MIAGSSAAVSTVGNAARRRARARRRSRACRRPRRRRPRRSSRRSGSRVADLGHLGPVRHVGDERDGARIGQPVLDAPPGRTARTAGRRSARRGRRRRGRWPSRAPGAGGSPPGRRGTSAVAGEDVGQPVRRPPDVLEGPAADRPGLVLDDQRRRVRPARRRGGRSHRPRCCTARALRQRKDRRRSSYVRGGLLTRPMIPARDRSTPVSCRIRTWLVIGGDRDSVDRWIASRRAWIAPRMSCSGCKTALGVAEHERGCCPAARSPPLGRPAARRGRASTATPHPNCNPARHAVRATQRYPCGRPTCPPRIEPVRGPHPKPRSRWCP